MHIRTLPRSRRSRNRRRSGRWIRCDILDRQWVAPSAAIGLYLLDDKRREVQRARDAREAPITFHPKSRAFDLERVVAGLGEGLYRLVARDAQGRILARRDFAATRWATPDPGQAQCSPGTEIEKVKADLAEARRAAEDAVAERDAARAELKTLKAAVAVRDEAINALEAEVERRGQQLDRARRLYARMGSCPGPGAPAGASAPDEGPGPEKASAPRGRKVYRRPRGKRPTPRPQKHADRSSSGAGLDLQTFQRACEIVARHMKEMRAEQGSGEARDEPDPEEDERGEGGS